MQLTNKNIFVLVISGALALLNISCSSMLGDLAFPPSKQSSQYSVKIYEETVDGKESLVETKKYTGYVGEKTNASERVKEKEGFVIEPFNEREIKTKGTYIKVIYKRVEVTYTFDAVGGKFSNGLKNYSVTGKYGQSVINVLTPVLTHNVFVGWQSDGKSAKIPSTFGASNVDFKACYLSIEDSVYKIEHYIQNLTMDGYDLYLSDQNHGASGNSTEAVAKDIEGFTPKTFSQEEILADDSTTVKIYYNRKSYTLTFDPNGGILVPGAPGEQIFYYGISQKINFSTPSKDEFKFDSWNETSTGSGSVFDEESYYTLTNDKSIYAQYIELKGRVLNNSGLLIDGELLYKTSDVVIIPYKTSETVECSTESYSLFFNDKGVLGSGVTNENRRGYFIPGENGRTVELSAYSMCQFLVTQELFQKVMGVNPSLCKETGTYPIAAGEVQKYRPSDYINWYDAIVFCNKLSVLMGLEPCYSNDSIDITNASYSSIPEEDNETWNATKCDFKKGGYRLPTDAEWEFAARGGYPEKESWNYPFAGVKSSSGVTSSNFNTTYKEPNIDEIGWYKYNQSGTTAGGTLSSGQPGYGTHEVGKKKPNLIGLYDVVGNLKEWCWDWHNTDPMIGDSNCKGKDGIIRNPTGPSHTVALRKLYHGGHWDEYPHICCVADRGGTDTTQNRSGWRGIRLARTRVDDKKNIN